MKESKMDLLTRCAAGAGYDISGSTANATPQAANQGAATIFNFGSGRVDAATEQTATPTANAKAAKFLDDGSTAITPDGSAGVGVWHEKIDWPMVVLIGVAVVAFGWAVHHAGKTT